MKNKRFNKLIWALIAVVVISGGVLIFYSEQSEPLEHVGKDPSIVAEKVDSSEVFQNSEIIAIIEKFKGSDNAQNSEIDALIEELKTSEITQDPEIKAKLEMLIGLEDLSKHLKDLEKHGLPPDAVKVRDSTSFRPRSVQYVGDDRAAELGFSRHQVEEFQKIVNYYRQQLDQHIIENSTIEVLGERYHKIKVPIMENSFEVRDAVKQELRLLLGDKKYDEFSKLDEGRLDKYFDLYGENPRTVEVQMIGERPLNDGLIKIKNTIHYKEGYSIWGSGRFTSKGLYHRYVYIDLINSYYN